MTITRYIIWIGLTVVYFVLLTLAQYPLRKRRLIPVRLIVLIVKAVLALAVAFFIISTDHPFALRFGFYLAPLYVVLVGDVAGDIISLPIVLIRKRKSSAFIQNILCMFLVMIYLAFGTANMQIVTANRVSIKSAKLQNKYKIVFVSDVHMGSAQSFDTIENMVVKISIENPDMVILGGDIVDEYTSKEDMERVFAEFGRLKVPVYYIYGNHDRQGGAGYIGGRTYSDDDLKNTISSNQIFILKDEWFYQGDDLMVIGREDYSSENRKDLSSADIGFSGFILVADHSPYECDENTKYGADLQLSGHTHAGQLFPLKTLYNHTGYDAYGFYKHGDTELYVSSGASGWSIPFRSEEGCHFDVIALEPEG